MIDVIATFAVFASAISVNKLILKSLPPLMFVGIRMGVAGLILLGYYSRQAGSRLSWHKVRTHIIYLIPIALASTYISSALKAYGLRHLLSSKVALIGSLDPFITALYGYVLWGQRFAWQHICGMCLGVLGVGGMLAVTRYNEMADQWWIF